MNYQNNKKKGIILSIKPEFASKIFDGEKKYEFRRSIYKDPEIRKVYVYASYPVMRIIGEFQIEEILNLKVPNLWEKTKKQSGITEKFFYQYFDKKDKGYALKISKPRKYRKSLCIKRDFNALPPQSFIYVY
jgi:predicted transcriptional regulator